MATLSVPLSPALETFIDDMVKKGAGANKADVVRQALRLFAEEQAILDVLKSEQDIKDGKVFYGDLQKIAAQLP